MPKKDLDLFCANAYVQAIENSVNVELKQVEIADVLLDISIAEIIEYYGKADILDQIGESACMDHFSND